MFVYNRNNKKLGLRYVKVNERHFPLWHFQIFTFGSVFISTKKRERVRTQEESKELKWFIWSSAIFPMLLLSIQFPTALPNKLIFIISIYNIVTVSVSQMECIFSTTATATTSWQWQVSVRCAGWGELWLCPSVLGCPQGQRTGACTLFVVH